MSNSENNGLHKISWLTLFYDVILVAVIARATYIYGKYPTWFTLVFISLTLLAVYVLWASTTLELMLSPEETWPRRALLFVQICALLLAGLAMYRGGGISDQWGFLGLAVSFASVGIFTLMRARDPFSDGRFVRPLAVTSFGTAIVFGVAALFPMKFMIGAVEIAWVFYAVGLGWAFVGMLIWAPRLITAPTRVQRTALNERFGVLLLIVLGDAFLQLLESLGALREIPAPGFVILSLVFVASVWLLYFPTMSEPELPTTPLTARIRIAAHFVLMLSAAYSIVAYVNLSTVLFGPNYKEGVHWTTWPVAGVAVAVLVLTLLHDKRWSARVWAHAVTSVVLIGMAVQGRLSDDLVREIDLVVANVVILVDALVALMLSRRALARGVPAPTPDKE